MNDQQSHWQVAFIRGLRSIIFAFAGFILVKWFGGDSHSATALVDSVGDNWDEAAGSGIIAGIIAFGWRSLLDPSAIPSLKDGDQPAPDGE